MTRNSNELKRSYSKSNQVQSPAQRQFRNENEKRRRDLFTQLITSLKEILTNDSPASTNDDHHKLDKASVLCQAAKYLQDNHQKLTDEAKSRLACVKGSPSPSPSSSSSSLVDLRWKAPCDIVCDEEWLEIAIESMNCFFLVVKNDYYSNEIVHVSKNVQAYLGYGQEQLIGRSLYEFIPPADHQRLRSYLANRHQVLQNCDVSWREAGGDGYEQCTIIGAFRNVNGNEAYLMSIVKVNTLDRSSIIEMHGSVTEFVTHLNMQGKFVFVDSKARELLGYTSFELIGRTYFDFIHPDDLTIMSRAYQLWKQNGNGRSDTYRFLTKGQQWIYLQTFSQAHVNSWTGNIESYICTTYIVQCSQATRQHERSPKSTSTLSKSSEDSADSSVFQPTTTMSSATTISDGKSSSSSSNEITLFLSKLRDDVYQRDVFAKLMEHRKLKEDEIRVRRDEIQMIDDLLQLVHQYQTRSAHQPNSESTTQNTSSNHTFSSNCDFLLSNSSHQDGIDNDSMRTASREDGACDPLESLFSSSSSTTMNFNCPMTAFPNFSSHHDLLEDINYLATTRDQSSDQIFPRSPFSQ